MNAVLFRSTARFDEFKRELEKYCSQVFILDFDEHEWISFDYSNFDIIIYFPDFLFSSSNPLALQKINDNLSFISERQPNAKIFPDPRLSKYYSDKYTQYLFLTKTNLKFPATLPLLSEKSIEHASSLLKYPMIVKNRYGAGGDYVFKIHNEKELRGYYKISKMDFIHKTGIKFAAKHLFSKHFWWSLLKARKLDYPFLSFPLIAQEFIPHDCDLKTVVNKGKIVEAHWRRKASTSMWKMNIDGGGIGEWSYVPDEPIALSEQLATALDASWLNIDIMCNGDNYYISEFSPVWHHYAYKEKKNFIYKDDYNIDPPPEESSLLEKLIVESFI